MAKKEEGGKVSKNAKVVKDAAQTAASKAYVRVIVAERSPKTGAYVFKEKIVHKDKVKEHLAAK